MLVYVAAIRSQRSDLLVVPHVRLLGATVADIVEFVDCLSSTKPCPSLFWIAHFNWLVIEAVHACLVDTLVIWRVSNFVCPVVTSCLVVTMALFMTFPQVIRF